ENEAVAHDYRKRLAGKSPISGELNYADMAIRQAGGNKDAALSYIDRELARGRKEGWSEPAFRQIQGERDLIVNDQYTPGRMYEVDLHARPEQFLDWDKPLSGQSGAMRSKLEEMGYYDPFTSSPDKTPQAILHQYGDKAPGQAREMADLGIPGIRYLDQ